MGFDMDQVARARGAEAVFARRSAGSGVGGCGSIHVAPGLPIFNQGGAGPDRRFAGAAGGQGGQGTATSHEIV